MAVPRAAGPFGDGTYFSAFLARKQYMIQENRMHLTVLANMHAIKFRSISTRSSFASKKTTSVCLRMLSTRREWKTVQLGGHMKTRSWQGILHLSINASAIMEGCLDLSPELVASKKNKYFWVPSHPCRWIASFTVGLPKSLHANLNQDNQAVLEAVTRCFFTLPVPKAFGNCCKIFQDMAVCQNQ